MRSRLVGLTFGIAMATATPAFAQAFVPAKGEASLTFLAEDVLVTKHMGATEWTDAGRVNGRNLGFDFAVGLGHKLAASVSLPYASSKYTGTKPHLLGPGEAALLPDFQKLDDGRYHGFAQDFRFDLRYNVTSRGVVLTPFVTAVIPSHDYPFLGHAAPGRDYRELQVGTYAAKVFRPWRAMPTSFVQVRYFLGLEEKIIDIRRFRNVVGFESGYFLTTRLRVFGMGVAQVTHGGVDVIVSPRADNPAPSPLYIHHDQIGRENSVILGGGAGFTLSKRIELFGSAVRTVSGINGHALAHLITVGASYSFSLSRRSQPKPAADDGTCHEDPNDPANALAKCVCLKK